MKHKLQIILLLLLFCSFQRAFAHYPIPSFNQPVVGIANFQESQLSPGGNIVNGKINDGRFSPMTRRVINIKIIHTVATPNGPSDATVWVYSLDKQTIIGPFTVYDDVLSVPIDDRDWGVIVDSDDEVIVDVWISAGDSKKPQNKNTKD
jgi:hypothetical protein